MNTTRQKISSLKNKFLHKYGYCADPALPDWKNLENYYLHITESSYFLKATNQVCHNYLPTDVPMPHGVERLLGRGLKFCVQRARPPPKLNKTFRRFKNDVRRMAYFREHPPEDDGAVRYIPSLYLRSETEWRPSNKKVERCLAEFEKRLTEARARYQRTSLTNLLPREWRLLETLTTDDYHIVVEADKNLGGCILLRCTYISRAIKEHLGNRRVYLRLTKARAEQLLHIAHYKMVIFCAKWRERITPAEHSFLLESTRRYHGKMPKFRMSLKAHKTPWKMRPIVCCVGTALNNLSRWLDY